jgi:methionyl-tRNA formyltransferase
MTLDEALPRLIAGTAPRRAQDLARGAYFGGRKPEDGRIDWSQPARRIHDLVRAVAPPYPGAWTEIGGSRLSILRTRVLDEAEPHSPARLVASGDRLVAECAAGSLQIIACAIDGEAAQCSPLEVARRFGPIVALG